MYPVPRVKICGITQPAIASQAAEAGVDALGLVFYRPSPRNLADLAAASAIAEAAGPLVQLVGLFVDPDIAWVKEVLRSVPLNTLQFHGDEDETFCTQFNRPYIKALRMKPGVDIEGQVARFASARGLLLDTYRAGTPGGTGEVFDWERIPRGLAQKIILAGGLTPQNVASAVAQVKPYGVDVSGGVEQAPGIKSPTLVTQFIRNAKGALPYGEHQSE